MQRIASVLGIGCLLAGANCSSTVSPPTQTDDPVEVGLIQDARHVGLLLPVSRSGEGFVEFVRVSESCWAGWTCADVVAERCR